jgi:hypothetical protein
VSREANSFTFIRPLVDGFLRNVAVDGKGPQISIERDRSATDGPLNLQIEAALPDIDVKILEADGNHAEDSPEKHAVLRGILAEDRVREDAPGIFTIAERQMRLKA